MAPNGQLAVEMSLIEANPYLDVRVYVKRSKTEDARETICATMRRFSGPYVRTVTVHYEGTRCWFSSP